MPFDNKGLDSRSSGWGSGPLALIIMEIPNQYINSLPLPLDKGVLPTTEWVFGAMLQLSLEHFELYERDALKVEEVFGIRPARLRNIGIRSVPCQTARILAAHAVSRLFGDGPVPSPFYYDNGKLKIFTPYHLRESPDGATASYVQHTGLIFPVKRADIVRSWLYYPSVQCKEPRWVSSFHLKGGSKASPSIHVISPEPAKETGHCILVDDALTAESLANGSPLSYAAHNRCTPAAVASQLREEWTELRSVLIYTSSIDNRLVLALEGAGLRTEIA